MKKNINTIQLSDIIIGQRFNSIDTKVVANIKKSINRSGLINPISILELDDGKYQLIAGYHRYTALKELGNTEITASVYNSLTTIEAQIIELEENIVRNQFDHFILGKLVSHLDSIYIKKDKSEKKGKQSKNDRITSKTGVKEREIQRSRKLHKKLSENPKLVKHLETKKGRITNEDLKRIAEMSTDKQEKFIELTKDNLNTETTKSTVKKLQEEIKNEKELKRLFNVKSLTKNVCYFGDSLEILRALPQNHFNHSFSDIPYGISVKKEMGKNSSTCKAEEWDLDVPDIELFAEIFRTIKPGGFFVTTFTPRSDLTLKLLDKLQEVGFDLRHNQMFWIHEPNLPRSYWVEEKIKESQKDGKLKGVDSSEFKGEKTPSIAPSVEPIIIAQKPFEGSIIEHATKAKNDSSISKGTINVEATKFNKRQPQQIISLEDINKMIGERFSIKNWSEKVIGNMVYVSKPNSERNYNYKGEELKLENSNDNDKFNDHASVKPIALYAYLLKLFNTDKDSLILEPFAGSGTTLIASKLLGMNYFGIEQDKGYYEITKQRLIQSKTYTLSDIKKI